MTDGRVFSVCWSGCGTIGGVLMRVSGRCAAGRGSSCIHESCAGWHSIAHCAWLTNGRFRDLSTSGSARETRSGMTSSRTFWSDELQSFVQAKGTKDLDAAALLMPMMRFISPVDPMWLSTMKAIEEHLIEDTLVRRYRSRTHSGGRPAGKRGQFHALLVLVRRMSGARG